MTLGALAGLRLYGTCSERDRAKVEALGAVAIDYRNEDFLKRLREEAGGVDVVVDSLGGPISLRSFRALRPGGRLAVFGRYSTLSNGHNDWPAVFKWRVDLARTEQLERQALRDDRVLRVRGLAAHPATSVRGTGSGCHPTGIGA